MIRGRRRLRLTSLGNPKVWRVFVWIFEISKDLASKMIQGFNGASKLDFLGCIMGPLN